VKDFLVLTGFGFEAQKKQTRLYIKYLHVTTMVNRLIENQMILVKIIPMITYLFEAQTLLCIGSSLELRYIDAFYKKLEKYVCYASSHGATTTFK
jgi:2-succinyl-5-enolpyruvyl-6-hydroxy-3-cyclohexene-1-carboxylate synthase